MRFAFATATASSSFIIFLTTSSVVDASLINKQRLLRGSSAVDEESPLYSADYYNYDSADYNHDSHDYVYKTVALEHHDGQDYNSNNEEEYPSLYQNPRRNWQRVNGASDPAADRVNGVGNRRADRRNGVGKKRADRINGTGRGICWACNGVPISQFCECRDGPRRRRRAGRQADRWVRQQNGRRSNPSTRLYFRISISI